MKHIATQSKICRAVLWLYCLYLLLPLYWLVNMALRTNKSIASGVELIPAAPTLANFAEIFTNPVWSGGFANSLSYVALNSAISLAVAVPAAFVFSRYRFMGDKHLFFCFMFSWVELLLARTLPVYSASGGVDSRRIFFWRVALG